jgi:hypothetical protein
MQTRNENLVIADLVHSHLASLFHMQSAGLVAQQPHLLSLLHVGGCSGKKKKSVFTIPQRSAESRLEGRGNVRQVQDEEEPH